MAKAVGKGKAMEMVMTGTSISAKEAKDYRIVNSVHPRDTLLEETLKIAKKIAEHSQMAAGAAKRAINNSFETGLQAGNDHERSLFISLLSTDDKKEGVKAFLEKRPPKFVNS